MADRLRLIARIRELITDDMTLVQPPEEVKHCELLVKTNAGYAFFSVVDPVSDIVQVWKDAQDEIAMYLRRLSLAQDRPGAYLALLVEGDRPKDTITMQKIAANPFVCRKIVIPGITEGNLREKVWQLPFFPLPDDLRQALGPLPPDPAVVLAETGLGASFIDRLLGRVGVDTIKGELLQGQYDNRDPSPPSPQYPVTTTETGNPPIPRLKVKRLRLRNFRNYGSDFSPIELAGDLVLVYGRNGTGKSSICEALEWGITGLSQRVSNAMTDEGIESEPGRSPLVNLRTGCDTASVDVWLEGAEEVHISRSTTSEGVTSVQLDGRNSDDREVLGKFSQVDADTSIRVDQNLRTATQGCHFLSQDTILDFLRNDPHERYKTYSFMAGTHHLAYAVRKTQRLLKLIQDDDRQKGAALSAAESQLASAHAERESYSHELQTLSPQHFDAGALVRQGLALVQKAAIVGVSLELPPASGVMWAQSAMETLLSLAPSRLDVLYQRIRNLERLKRDSIAIESVRENVRLLEQERDQLLTKVARLVELADQLQQAQTRTRQAMAELRAKHSSAETYRDRLTRLAVLNDRSEQLVADMQNAEEALSSHEQALQQLALRLEDVRAKRNSAEEAAKALGEKDRRVSGDLAALARALEDSIRRQSRQKQLDMLRGELESVYEREAERAEARSQLQRELDEAQAAVNHRETTRNEYRQFVERRQELLAELKANVRSEEKDCPVCGAGYKDHGTLMARISQVLELLPEGLKAATEALSQAQANWSRIQEAMGLVDGELTRLSLRRAKLVEDVGELQSGLDAERSAFLEVLPDFAEIWLDPNGLKEAIQQQERSKETLRLNLAGAIRTAEQLAGQATQLESEWKAAALTIQDIKVRIEQMRSDHQQSQTAVRALALPPLSRDELAGASEEQQASISKIETEIRTLEAGHADNERQLHEAIDSRGRLAKEIDAATQRLTAQIDQVQAYETDLRAEGIVSSDPVRQAEQIEAMLADRRIYAEDLAQLVPAAEKLLAQVNAYRIRTEVNLLDSRIDVLRKERDRVEDELGHLRKRLSQVETILTNLQQLKADQDAERLGGLEPLAVHLYQRLNAHPYFGGLDVEVNSRKQELYIRFRPEPEGELTAEVNRYYSAAQAIGVALSIFMGTALLQSWSDVGLICMDDPVQHLDDINVYALLDVVHNLVHHGRQVIFTTASEDLYKIMLWRFAMLNTAETPRRFQAFRLTGITETGPEVHEDTPRVRKESAS